ncbi:MAG: hypothetical protein NTW21_37495 [Verrucomicrobia bacterium]|nr:hypothetical protein [Verrucomicrobiota bacterium]
MKQNTLCILLTFLALGVATLNGRAAEPASPDPYADETPAQRDVRMQG